MINHLTTTFVIVRVVKQILQFAKPVVLFAIISLLLIGRVSTADTYFSKDSPHSTQIVLASTDLLSLTNATERFFENIQRVLSAPSKLGFDDYLDVVDHIESRRDHLLKKRMAFTRCLVARFNAQDIVFPFHHFW